MGFFFATVFYRAIPQEMRYENVLGFYLLWFACLMAGVCTTPQSRYTISTAMGILVIPFSVNCLVMLDDALLFLLLVLCILAVSIYTITVICVCFPDMRKGHYRKKWLRFLQRYLFRSRTIISAVCIAALIGMSGYGWIENCRAEKGVDGSLSQNRAEMILETMGGNADLISQLYQNQWESLSEQERLAVLQQVADIECDYLGIPYQLVVSAAEMERSSVLGFYSYANHAVCINKELFSMSYADTILAVLLHEVYHSFEYAVVEVYERTEPEFQTLRLFEDAWIYCDEFDHYISGTENYDVYERQRVEVDSNVYSDRRLREYQEVINYLK